MHDAFVKPTSYILCIFTVKTATVQAFMCSNKYIGVQKGSILAKNTKNWEKVSLLIAVLTWAALDTRGPEVVLSMWVEYQLVQVGVVAHEAWTGVLTHPVVLEVPTGLQHKQQSSSAPGP